MRPAAFLLNTAAKVLKKWAMDEPTQEEIIYNPYRAWRGLGKRY
jgi:hypothetical protein